MFGTLTEIRRGARRVDKHELILVGDLLLHGLDADIADRRLDLAEHELLVVTFVECLVDLRASVITARQRKP